MKLAFLSNCFSFSIAAILFVSANLSADIVVNFNNQFGGGASLADFTVADPLLDATTPFFFANGIGGFTGFNQSVDGLTFTTTGTPANGGFAANQPANAVNPILGGNLFDTGADTLGISVSGLSSLTAGDVVTVVGFGIGDSIGQDVIFDANFTGPAQSAATAFNDGSSPSAIAGSVPFQAFTFTADGLTDNLTLVSTGTPDAAGNPRSHFNGFSLSVTPVPEPTGLAFVGGLMLAGAMRRKRS